MGDRQVGLIGASEDFLVALGRTGSFERPSLEVRLEPAICLLASADEKNAARLAVEAMNQAQGLPGSLLFELFDDGLPVVPRGRMHRHQGRLVHDQKVLVFVEGLDLVGRGSLLKGGTPEDHLLFCTHSLRRPQGFSFPGKGRGIDDGLGASPTRGAQLDREEAIESHSLRFWWNANEPQNGIGRDASRTAWQFVVSRQLFGSRSRRPDR
jgi:hypothetical protein